jgi:hypothetical protein
MPSDGRDVRRQGGSKPCADAVHGLGMIGAWVRNRRSADTTGDRALGALGGLAWPTLLVYEAFSAVGGMGRPDTPD